jgi:hypothetical protein
MSLRSLNTNIKKSHELNRKNVITILEMIAYPRPLICITAYEFSVWPICKHILKKTSTLNDKLIFHEEMEIKTYP